MYSLMALEFLVLLYLAARLLFGDDREGVDVVDLAIASMSGSTSQPNLNSTVASLQHTPRDTRLDLEALKALGVKLEFILTSPLLRAAQTAGAVAELHGDAAIEAADVALLSNDLTKVTEALNTFKKVMTYANTDYSALTWDAAAQYLVDGKGAIAAKETSAIEKVAPAGEANAGLTMKKMAGIEDHDL